MPELIANFANRAPERRDSQPSLTRTPATIDAAAPVQRLAQLASALNGRTAETHERDGPIDLRQAEVAQRRAVIQREIDLTGAQEIKPGPPATLLLDGWYYKVLGSKVAAEAISAQWQTADDAAIPVPRFGVKQVRVAAGLRWAFRSKGCAGTFFQFSKPGHLARVTGWIATQTTVRELERLRNMFTSVAATIGDGQGFFEPGSTNIKFIDINTGGTTPLASDAAEACTARIAAL